LGLIEIHLNTLKELLLYVENSYENLSLCKKYVVYIEIGNQANYRQG